MKNKKILFLVLILFFAFSGCFKNDETNNQKEQNNSAKEQSNNIVASKSDNDDLPKDKTSLEKLIKAGQPLACSVKWLEEGQDFSAQYYIHKEKIRIDMNISGKTNMKSYTILDDKVMYSWQDNTNSGYKISFDTSSNEQDFEGDTYLNMEKELDFKCEKWQIDNNKFIPPQDIEFIDFANQINNLENTLNDIDMGQICDKCGKEKNSANKKECLNSLGCN